MKKAHTPRGFIGMCEPFCASSNFGFALDLHPTVALFAPNQKAQKILALRHAFIALI